MKRPIWEKRIPTLFALLLVAGSIFATGYLLKQQSSTIGRASQESSAENIVISDLSDTSFSVAFTTKTPSVAGVKVSGPNFPESVFFSSPDQSDLVTHRITIPNLTPNTEYSFSILLQGKELLDQNQPFVATTSPAFEKNVSVVPVNGSILTAEGKPAQDVLVVLYGEGSQKLSTLTNQEGNYTFDLGNLRTATLSEPAIFTSESSFTLEAHYMDLSSSSQLKYENISTIPAITLSQNYNFGILLEDDTESSPNAHLTLPTPATIESSFTVNFPTEGQSLIDSRPSMRGTAFPLSQVTITLDSQNAVMASADESGRWQYRPESSLSQGEHTVVYRGRSSDGTTKTISRNFSIFPSGSQIAQSATPSATLTPIVTVSPTSTPSPSATTTPIPSLSVTSVPTPTATIAPTATNIPQPTVPPVTTITPTPPGSFTTVMVTFASVILIVAGTTLLFILG